MPRATWDNVGDDPFGSELDEFEVYEGEQPPKGVYRCFLKGLRLKENKNNDKMLNGLLIIAEPKSSKKAQYNGYGFWFNLNITKQGAPWVNNFLAAIAPAGKSDAIRKAFWQQKVMIDKDEPPNVISIGILKITGGKDIFVKANCKFVPAKGDYDEKLDVLRFLPDTDSKPVDEDEDEETSESEEGWEETEESETDSDEDEEIAEREEELGEFTLAQLKRIARGEHGMKLAEIKGMDEEDLIEAILEKEFPEEEEEPAEEESDIDEEQEEEPAEPEEEEEEPPAKPARGRKGATRSTRTATKSTGRTRGRKTDEPPF